VQDQRWGNDTFLNGAMTRTVLVLGSNGTENRFNDVTSVTLRFLKLRFHS